MVGVKDQVMSLFKTWDYSKSKRVKTFYRSKKKPNKLRIQKQSEEEIIIKNIRNLFKLKKDNETIKDRISRDIKTVFENQEEDYYKPERVRNVWNNNYIEYESKGGRNKNISVNEYLNKIKPYLRDIINNPQKSDT